MIPPQEVVQLYRAGHSLRKLAKRYGCAHATVRTTLLRAGEPRRPLGLPPPLPGWMVPANTLQPVDAETYRAGLKVSRGVRP